jgi:hypothetical protein
MCGRCGDIRALDPEPTVWVTCRCGNLSGHWTEPYRGICEFKALDKSRAFGLGLNNHLLMPALRGELAMHEDFRAFHELATDAPGFVFDKTKCGCWAVPFRIGATSDTSFVKEEPPDVH